MPAPLWEPELDGEAIRQHPRVVGLGRQKDQPTLDPARSPPEPSSRCPRLALIPTQGSLDLAEVVDLRLELDHEHDAAHRMEGKDVDPAARSVATDLDLRGRRPAVVPEATCRISTESSVCRVALPCPCHERRYVDPDIETRAHRLQDVSGSGDPQGRLHVPLDSRHHRGGYAGPASQLGLGPADRDAHGSDRLTNDVNRGASEIHPPSCISRRLSGSHPEEGVGAAGGRGAMFEFSGFPSRAENRLRACMRGMRFCHDRPFRAMGHARSSSILCMPRESRAPRAPCRARRGPWPVARASWPVPRITPPGPP